MALFIALHQVTPHMAVADAAQIVYRVLKHEKRDTQWQRYWWSDETGKLFCLWEAPTAEAVWDTLRSASVPTDAVYQVEEGDPGLLRAGLKR